MSCDLKFKYPFTCILSGRSSSVISSFCVRFLQLRDALCTERDFDDGVIWYHSEETAVPSPTVVPKRNILFKDSVPEDFDNTLSRPCHVILDDLLNDAYSKQVRDLYTKGRHHRNLSLILINQNTLHRVVFVRTFP